MYRKALLAAVLGVSMAASGAFADTAVPPAKEHPGSIVILLGLDSVRADLHLTSLQKALLDSLRSDYREEARAIVATAPTTPDARLKADLSLTKVTDEYKNRALSVLNSSQRSRFLEIEHQVVGPTHLYSAGEQKKLGLSADQIARIEKVREKALKYVAKQNAEFEAGKITYMDRVEILRARRIEDGNKIMSILTPQQQQVFVAQGGRKFTI